MDGGRSDRPSGLVEDRQNGGATLDWWISRFAVRKIEPVQQAPGPEEV
jgi:hypothetical protein